MLFDLIEQRQAVVTHFQIDHHAGDGIVELAVVHPFEPLAHGFGVACGSGRHVERLRGRGNLGSENQIRAAINHHDAYYREYVA